ncbi:hypothetical protein [Moraxella lacunata]|uniref:hypothetical protein n=1 Tax=Moraxella lacunata TaxID=477 RepID=UPI003EE0649D
MSCSILKNIGRKLSKSGQGYLSAVSSGVFSILFLARMLWVLSPSMSTLPMSSNKPSLSDEKMSSKDCTDGVVCS